MKITDKGRRIIEYEFLLWEYKRSGCREEVIKELEDKLKALKQGKIEFDKP